MTLELDVSAPATATTKEFHYHAVLESKFKHFVPVYPILGLSWGFFVKGEVVRGADGHLVLSADIGVGTALLNETYTWQHFGPYKF